MSRTPPDAWRALAQCRYVAIYTDGSAPIRNPGGPTGCAAIAVGYDVPSDPDRPHVAPRARVDIGAHIPARRDAPPTSSMRAELAGVLSALAILRHLTRDGAAPEHVTIWCDNRTIVNCGTGTWKRKKNLDLWAVYDHLIEHLTPRLATPLALTWIKGHAGMRYNEAADVLATRAALNFDDMRYARYRAAQAATGREMLGSVTRISPAGADGEQEITPASSEEERVRSVVTDSSAWLRGADYTLVLYTASDGAGPACGRYQIWIRDGRGRRGEVIHAGQRSHDEAEYRTLIAALADLLGRITARSHVPSAYTLTVYSRYEMVAKQIAGTASVHSSALRPLHAQALNLLGRFKRVDSIWQQGPAIECLLGSECPDRA